MHKPEKILVLIMVLGLASLFMPACERDTATDTPEEGEPLQLVVTLSFFEDMVNQVGGEKVDVKALVPVGVEPEDYEPTPSDVGAIEDADYFIYNGLNMERWLPQVISDLEERENFKPLAEDERFDTIPLPDGPFEGDPDPHLWTNVNYAIKYVEQIGSVLAEADPENQDYFQERMEDYREELKELHQWIKEQVEKIPEDRRMLITSELCYQYFAEEYGFFHDAIWPINAPEEGTTSQIIRIVEIIGEKDIPVVFVENQVDPRPMEQVAQEAGVTIGAEVYSDSLSEPGEGGETYLEMMRSNTSRIVEALQEEGEE